MNLKKHIKIINKIHSTGILSELEAEVCRMYAIIKKQEKIIEKLKKNNVHKL